MNSKLIKIVIGLVLVASLAACAAPAGNSPYPRSLNGSGQGKVYLTPDVSYINIGVHSEADTVTAALDDNTGKAQSIKDAILQFGVEEKDIQTSAFNVSPQQKYGPNGEMLGTFYVVDNTVIVTVRDLGQLGKILDAVTRNGANSINGISFDVLDKEAALKEARTIAIDAAKQNAQDLAAAAGVQLGVVITMNVSEGGLVNPMYDYKAYGGTASQGSVPISAGQMVITVDASIQYEIK
jgi:uncharacterized protein YggE